MNKPRVSSPAHRAAAVSEPDPARAGRSAAGSTGPAPGVDGAVDRGDLAASDQAPALRQPVAQDYETAVDELETLVDRMEDGRFTLEESLAAYQRGVDLVRYCREQLAVVEQKVKVLEAGLLQPFEADGIATDDEGDCR